MKKEIYIIFTAVLFIFLFTLLYYGFELFMIKELNREMIESRTGQRAAAILILLAGIFVGYFVGQRWWRIIYIEKRYCK